MFFFRVVLGLFYFLLWIKCVVYSFGLFNFFYMYWYWVIFFPNQEKLSVFLSQFSAQGNVGRQYILQRNKKKLHPPANVKRLFFEFVFRVILFTHATNYLIYLKNSNISYCKLSRSCYNRGKYCYWQHNNYRLVLLLL